MANSDLVDRRAEHRRRWSCPKVGCRCNQEIRAAIELPKEVNIWIVAEATEMRRGFDGLRAKVQGHFRRNHCLGTWLFSPNVRRYRETPLGRQSGALSNCEVPERQCVQYNTVRSHSTLATKPPALEAWQITRRARRAREMEEEVAMILFYVDPGSSSLLMQILAPVFVVLSLMSNWIRKQIVRVWQSFSRQLGREDSGR